MTGVHIHKGLYTVIGHAMRYGVCCIRQAPQNLYTSPSTSLLSSWFCLKPSTGSCISQRNRRTHSSLPWITRKDIWHVSNSLKAARVTSIILHKRWGSIEYFVLVVRIFAVDMQTECPQVTMHMLKSECADPSGRAVCGYWLAGSAVSNPTGAMVVCLLWMFYAVR